MPARRNLSLLPGVTAERWGSACGAGEGIRTPDPLITNQMLYQLSYASKNLPATRHKT